MASILLRRRGWVAAGLVLVLAACGGGGGGDSGPGPSEAPVGPPATAAALGTTSAEATEVVKAAVAGADGLAARYTSMNSFTALFGVPIAQGQAVPMAALRAFARVAPVPGRQRALAVTNVGCLEVVDGPCTGSAVFDTNIPDTATSVSAGQYLEVTFNAISGYVLGLPVTLSGRLRVEFLTAVNLNAAQLTSVSMRLKFVNLAGSADGVAYGPLNELLDLNLDSTGEATLTSGGARYGTLEGVSVTGAGSYSIGSGTVRSAFASTGGYADLRLTNWRSSGGRALAGSQGSVSAGSTTAAVSVLSSSSTSVVYGVTFTAGASVVSYRVTGAYAGGTGSPSYTVASGS
ncbi:MAG: hypothetical protein JNM33_09395 [Rubrivivax sp.]|nr:hypothetical protein [Rubrivivax sp.]